MPKFKFPKLKLMPKLNAKTHIAMGLAFLVVTLLLAAVSCARLFNGSRPYPRVSSSPITD